ncbi:putative rhodanese domain containing protein [Diaporthe ampelina]|uniref:Putative rhodanese domain containing protein n=1 Tax=Diaporthe ampelina TaxID=1214573 RepID=A0A0G2FJB2_9PEZI|nr:putative rhodanese domain containing protein [Diaporthe ampelina]
MASTRTLQTAANALRLGAYRTGLASSRSLLGSAAARVVRQPAPGPRHAVAAVPSGIRRYSQQQLGESKIWSFEDIQKLTQESKRNVVIVDVREPGELKSTGHVPGAVNIPVTSQPDSFHIAEEDFEDRFGYPRPAKDQEVVFYCKAGVRSRAAAGLAKDAGWSRVGEYPGSWLDWAEKGGKVER